MDQDVRLLITMRMDQGVRLPTGHRRLVVSLTCVCVRGVCVCVCVCVVPVTYRAPRNLYIAMTSWRRAGGRHLPRVDGAARF